jgi:hypothetical protein
VAFRNLFLRRLPDCPTFIKKIFAAEQPRDLRMESPEELREINFFAVQSAGQRKNTNAAGT